MLETSATSVKRNGKKARAERSAGDCDPIASPTAGWTAPVFNVRNVRAGIL
jgi:hypothetical protein